MKSGKTEKIVNGSHRELFPRPLNRCHENKIK